MTTAVDPPRALLTPGGEPFLTAKFLPPTIKTPLVERPRLLELLATGAAGPLTLISAPAGTGKTVLVSSWAASGGAPGSVAWITLDAADDDPGLFWAYMVMGLVHAGLDLANVGIPERVDFVEHSFLVRLAANLSSQPAPVVLVLDRAEHLTSQQILDDLDFVLHHAGSRLRLVVCTRRDLELSLPRRRLEGTVAEIRFSQLAFTPEESAVLLAAKTVNSCDGATARFPRWAGGWAAALRLGASLAESGGGSGSGNLQALAYSDLAAYFRAEVLDVQPPSVRETLLATSVVEQVTGPLAEYLCGQQAVSTLRALARSQLFVEALDGGASFAYHPLARELLQAQLHQESRHRYRRLHRKAATWFAAVGRPLDAATSFVAGGDWEDAVDVLVTGASVAHLLAGGQGSALAALLRPMPPDLPGPAAAVVAAALALVDGDPGECERHLLRATEWSDARADDGAFHLSVALVQLALSGVAGDAEEAMRAAAAARATVKEHPSQTLVFALISSGLGRADLDQGRFEAAGQKLSYAARMAKVAGSTALLQRTVGTLALVEALRGNLTSATASGRHVLQPVTASDTPEGQLGEARLALAWACLQRSDVAGAEEHASLAQVDTPLGRAVLALVRCGVRRARGDLHGALLELDAVDNSATSNRTPLWASARVRAERAHILVAQGQAEQVVELLRPSSGTGASATDLARAAAQLAAGHPAEAARIARKIAAETSLPLDLHVEALLLVAACALTSSQSGLATAALDDAWNAARPERLQRPFDLAPVRVSALVRQRIDQSSASAGRVPRPALPPVVEGPALVEPLTAREQEVLGYLDALVPTDEIARSMYVSINTVKTHVRAILRKLSAEGRYDAVRRARQLGML